MALCASSSELISTKPKPRERPVARSVRIVALTHVPALENNSRRSLSDVSKDRLPTNSFLPMSFSSWEKDGVPTMGTHGTHAWRVSEWTDVLGRWPLLAFADLELDALPFAQALVSLSDDGRVMDENILRAVVRTDETETLFCIEPFHLACCHRSTPLSACDIRTQPSVFLVPVRRD